MSRRKALVRWLAGVRDRLDAGDIAARPATMPHLDAEDVQLDAFQLVRQVGVGWDVAFLDLRDAEARAKTGVLPGAVGVDGDVSLDEADAHELWVLYGDDAQTVTDAVLHLRGQGHGDVWCLVDGIEGWIREGGSVEAG